VFAQHVQRLAGLRIGGETLDQGVDELHGAGALPESQARLGLAVEQLGDQGAVVVAPHGTMDGGGGLGEVPAVELCLAELQRDVVHASEVRDAALQQA